MSRFTSGPGRVKLIDGPGQGQKFFAQRAPVLLRVVLNYDGRWDVLDQLEDEPTAQEEIFVYHQSSWMHVRANKRSDSGTYYEYTHWPIDNIQKSTLRYNDRWRTWASLQLLEERHGHDN